MTSYSENNVMTYLFLLLLCFINLGIYIGDPHVQIIVVFCAVSERLILTPERFRFLIQALSTSKVIYHGRCIPELMQFVNKDFLEKISV